MMAPKQL
jgi:hypothetical protein